MRRVLFLWLTMASLTLSAATDYYFRTVDATNGLADNFVRDIANDSRGYMWFSTINGVSRYDGYRTVNYLPRNFGGKNNDASMIRETADSTLWMMCHGQLFTYSRNTDKWLKDGEQRLKQLGIEGTVNVFYVDDGHNLWVSTDTKLFHYDYASRQLQQTAGPRGTSVKHIVSKGGTTVVVGSDYSIYRVKPKTSGLERIAQATATTYTRDSRVFLDSQKNLWLYSSYQPAGTAQIFSMEKRTWVELPAFRRLGDALHTLTEDGEGRLWVGTGNTGIHVFEYQTGGSDMNELTSINPFTSHNSHITCFFLDGNNTMWVGSSKLGIAFADMYGSNFDIQSTGPLEDVSSLLRDRQGNLWISFDGGGIMKKSPAGAVQHFSAQQHRLHSDIVTALALHPDGSLLAGTYGSGIAKFNGTSFAPFCSDNPYLKYVKAMAADTQGNLWVGTVDRGVVNIRKDGRMVNYTSENSNLMSNGVLCLASDSLRDIIYIGTSAGVSVFDCAKRQFLKNTPLDSLKDIYVTSLMMCSNNSLWIGSRSGLWIYRPKEGTLTHLTTEQGMSHNTVRALTQNQNRIWASTANGLTCITETTGDDNQPVYKCFPLFGSDGLHNTIFSNNAALTTPDGHTLLGCYTGYVSIGRESFNRRDLKLHVEFTDFHINGREAPQFRSDHTIGHDERLTIFLSAMVPTLSQKIRYLYRFKGEKEWMSTPENYLYFASLNYGTHVLQVKAEIPGMIESDIAELTFRVKPPLWLSLPALLLYVLLLASLAYLVYKAIRNKQKREFAIRKLELNLKKYEMEEDKIRFFTNISHDLKTPLSLVVAPLEKIRQTNLPAPIRTEVDVAWRNARQLNDLVMELLDFRRLDAGMEKLRLKHGDIVSFVRQTAQGFSYYATPKRVQLILDLPHQPAEISFDENKMRRIITNLLSNAYKYNVDDGTVTVGLSVDEQQMTLSVADTGIGVNDKQRIFDRFVQETHGQEQEGSGLGLHIVRHYTDMMGGSIAVADNKPRGTIFTVTIPVSPAVAESADAEKAEATAQAQTIADDASQKPTILVVEDNLDSRQFLQRSLDDEYNVITAANGKEALRRLSQHGNVKLVVTDVMMPEMDGIELFRQIRGNISFSHIPVILLTAKSGEENIISGLREGAADYITKPYSLEVLQLRIQKIMQWTENAYSQVGKGIDISPSEITVSSLDEELIGRIMESIEANMQNTEYSVVQLSSDVNMTRGHLYKKLMAITGKSPLEFIRIVKIKRGKSLLDQGRKNISEVADRVGLSPKQFSYYFKNIYGETPSDYLKNNK